MNVTARHINAISGAFLIAIFATQAAHAGDRRPQRGDHDRARSIAQDTRDHDSLDTLGRKGRKSGSGGGGTSTPALPVLQSWMHDDVGSAWSQGYTGSGVTITIVDDFSSRNRYQGNFGDGSQLLRHGEWTSKEAAMLAPTAAVRLQDFNTNGGAVALNTGLNVLNLSYGMMAGSGYSLGQLSWNAREQSIINAAHSSQAVIAKAAGNDGVVLTSSNASGQVDYLNLALRGAPTAIYAGALNSNGSTSAPATLASYSNRPGTDAVIQNQFLVVGVEGSKTGLYGTSFAAPIISGYAAIVGSKFTAATPAQISNQLLSTARQDTIKNYNAAQYGRGEASLSRALAPTTIQ